MASLPGFVVGLTLAERKGIPRADAMPVALVGYTLGMTLTAIVAIEALSERLKPAVRSPAGAAPTGPT